MWLYNNYFLFTFLALLMNCNFVENNDPKENLYGNIYSMKNVVPSKMGLKILEIINSVLLGKPVVIDSMRKHNTNEQEIELTGAIVILVKNDKHKYTTQKKSLKKQKYIGRVGKKNREIVVAIVDNSIKRDTMIREGLSIEDSRDLKLRKTLDRLTPNILRDKYGDACIKVAIRKCYKALIAVNNNVCKIRYKCSYSFRSHFKNKSKVGCIKEFDYSKGTNNEKNSTYYTKFRDNTFVDATREGYLDACIPYMVPNYKVLRRTITLRNDTLPNVLANVPRKRRSDKKCQRLSRVKCYRACLFALQETCAKHDCSRRRKRIFNKICKEECKRAYRVKGTSDSGERSSDSD